MNFKVTWPQKANKEDKLLRQDVIDLLKAHHNIKPIELKWHQKIEHEIDAILIAKTPAGLIRTFGFELKENDLRKAVIQAVVRRKLFNYFYIISYAHPAKVCFYLEWALRNGKHGLLEIMKKYGIGWIINLKRFEVEDAYASLFQSILLLSSKFKPYYAYLEVEP